MVKLFLIRNIIVKNIKNSPKGLFKIKLNIKKNNWDGELVVMSRNFSFRQLIKMKKLEFMTINFKF